MLNDKAKLAAIKAAFPNGKQTIAQEICVTDAIAAYLSALLPEDAAGLVERLEKRAKTINGASPVGAGDGNTYALGYYDQFAAKDDLEAASLIQSQAARIAELEAKVAAQVHRATNAEYFNVAYRNMLGPVGRQVAEMWREKGVRRVHFDWGPEADNLTGEERAQIILDVENAPSRVVEDIDGHGNGPRTKGSRSFVEFVADLTKDRQP